MTTPTPTQPVMTMESAQQDELYRAYKAACQSFRDCSAQHQTEQVERAFRQKLIRPGTKIAASNALAVEELDKSIKDCEQSLVQLRDAIRDTAAACRAAGVTL